MSAIQSVAIIGGGPAGAALGIHLVRAGVRVVLFDPGRRPALIVGESLVPALVPLLQELGVEQEVAAVSTYKPGATFYTTPEQEVSFVFRNAGRGVPGYAYNSPRREFDQILLAHAKRLGVAVVQQRAGVSVEKEGNAVRLDDQTRAVWEAHAGSAQPDIIVDATGRARVFAKLLAIPTWEGARKDVALFAHVKTADTPHQGHIHINRLKRGWSWRIPLPGRVSLGVVIPHDALQEYGATSEEQYERLCQEEPILRTFIQDRTRITPIMRYSNYQLNSSVWTGENWALVGDAGGFIDPIFSSGLLLALEGARELSRAILGNWEKQASRYEHTMQRKISAWRGLIDSYYDGSMFSLFRLRRIYRDNRAIGWISKVIDRQLALALSGVAPESTRRLWLLRVMLRWLGRTPGQARYRIAATLQPAYANKPT